MTRTSLLDALRADLLDADYTVDGVRDLLGTVAADALDRDAAVAACRAVEAAGEVSGAVLLRLLQLGHAVPASAVDRALPRLGAAGAVRLGLLTPVTTTEDGDVTVGEGSDGDGPRGGGAPLRAALDLAPYAATDADGDVTWWIASDLGEIARGGALPEDYVLGVGGASRTLAQITSRRRVGRVLDLGTGCGIQALHASRHADHVVATDIDPRALDLAGLNAELAGVTLDLRAGSMLEPVAGERFDLVVSNPPFVITPRDGGIGEFTYRDGGARGDDLVHALIASVGSVLAPGGVAQLLGNWEHRSGQDWAERVGGWLDESGLDGWIVQREVQDPAEYAELWLRDGGLTPDRDRAGYETAYRAWLADLESREVTGIGFGFVTLRRPLREDAPRWRRVEEITGTVQQPLGEVVARVLDAVEDLREVDDAALLARHWQVAGDVTEERFHTPGEPQPRIIVLRAGGGFGRTVRADTALAAFVGACDGELSGSQIVAALAALLEVDGEALPAELAPQVRGLAIDGLLLPA